jgi:hypothetical protein
LFKIKCGHLSKETKLQTTSSFKEIKTYLTLASYGHTPLFFEDWIKELGEERPKMSYAKAKTTVKKVFKNLEKHKSLEKKKTALLTLSGEERKAFVKSFFRMVEHEMVGKIENLH